MEAFTNIPVHTGILQHQTSQTCPLTNRSILKKDAVYLVHIDEVGKQCRQVNAYYPFAVCDYFAQLIEDDKLLLCPNCRGGISEIRRFENLTDEEKQAQPLSGRIAIEYLNEKSGDLARAMTTHLDRHTTLKLSGEEMNQLREKVVKTQKEKQKAQQVTHYSEDDEPCIYVRLYHAVQRTGVANIFWAVGAIGVIGVVTVWDSIMGPTKPINNFEKSRVR